MVFTALVQQQRAKRTYHQNTHGNLVLKVAHGGKHHRQSSFICSVNHILITHRTTGLNDTARTRSCGFKQAVSKGEKRI
jgi:hypothetical protein